MALAVGVDSAAGVDSASATYAPHTTVGALKLQVFQLIVTGSLCWWCDKKWRVSAAVDPLNHPTANGNLSINFAAAKILCLVRHIMLSYS